MSQQPQRSQPWVRMVRRPTIKRGSAWSIRATAFILALLTGAAIVAALGHDPLAVYGEMVRGAFGSQASLTSTVKIAIPLLIAALSVALSFKMRFWNIGAEGQILAGGIAATYFALYWVDTLPALALFVLMFAAAAAAGAIWGLIPALCKAKWNTNETLFTLMLNYVALGLVKYLQAGPWQKPGGQPHIAMISEAARLPKLFGVHIGWVVAIILVIFTAVFLYRSKAGFETAVVGESPHTARYSGMSVGRVLARTMALAGAMAGIVGFLQVSGADHTLTENTAGGVGFTAITVAWLAHLNPIAMVLVAIFIAVLKKGAGRIQTTYSIPASASDVLIGVILFFMLGCEFFINYRLIFRNKEGK